METGINNRLITPIILLLIILTSCQAAPPTPPITASVSDEFILRPGQSATILDTGLTLKLIAISSDERCPLEIECAMSGPVTLSISLQSAENPPAEFTLQTFTDNNGRAPGMSFEGIQDRMEFEGYNFQVKAVLPYPLKRSGEIKDSEYQVSFIVTTKRVFLKGFFTTETTKITEKNP
jgi:hypothetical protein